MNHGSLFSGIGGFDLAAQWMGWDNIFQVEWDDWCQKILTKNFPDVPKFRDIVEFNKMLKNGEIITDTESIYGSWNTKKKRRGHHEQSGGVCISQPKRITKPDIITGGFPCQPFSHAGKRGGESDERYLWPEMLTTIRMLKPTYIVGENVVGLVSMDNGKTLDTILTDLENEGYTVESFIIPACAIGAWHRRDRIWIIAYCNKGRLHTQRTEFRETDKRREANTISRCSKDVPDTDSKYSKKQFRGDKLGSEIQKEAPGWSYCKNGGIWEAESSVGRVAHGIPDRMDRLKGLGNAIVPQVAYEIFKAIEQL